MTSKQLVQGCYTIALVRVEPTTFESELIPLSHCVHQALYVKAIYSRPEEADNVISSHNVKKLTMDSSGVELSGDLVDLQYNQAKRESIFA